MSYEDKKVFVTDQFGKPIQREHARSEADAIMEAGDPIFVVHAKTVKNDEGEEVQGISVWTADPPNVDMLNLLIGIVNNYGALVQHVLAQEAQSEEMAEAEQKLKEQKN